MWSLFFPMEMNVPRKRVTTADLFRVVAEFPPDIPVGVGNASAAPVPTAPDENLIPAVCVASGTKVIAIPDPRTPTNPTALPGQGKRGVAADVKVGEFTPAVGGTTCGFSS